MRDLYIGQRRIGAATPVYIVAEMSANHHQDFEQAVRIIKAAKDAGADAIKLQTYTPDTITIDCANASSGSGLELSGKGKIFTDSTAKPIRRGNGNPS